MFFISRHCVILKVQPSPVAIDVKDASSFVLVTSTASVPASQSSQTIAPSSDTVASSTSDVVEPTGADFILVSGWHCLSLICS